MATKPSKATSKAQPVRSDAAEPPSPSEPAGAQDDPAETGSAATDEEGEVFLNRAQRRAKGRNPGQAQFSGRGKIDGGHGPASTQRNWANRRSG